MAEDAVLIPVQEACERLRISLSVFRRLYKEHGDELPPLGEREGLKVVPEAALPVLQRLIAAGRQPAATGARPGGKAEEAPGGPAEDSGTPPSASKRPEQAPAEKQEPSGREAESGHVSVAAAAEEPQSQGTGRAETADAAEQAVAVAERIERLIEQLRRNEERQQEERDRLITMLLRTQQEIQHLRYEVAAGSSRRDRKRGFWGRWRKWI